jgi:hypothetical protein
MATMYENLSGNCVGGVELTFVLHFTSVHLFFLYWVIQNDCGLVWQLCTKIYLATVWVG